LWALKAPKSAPLLTANHCHPGRRKGQHSCRLTNGTFTGQ